jgi:hypothetical protein
LALLALEEPAIDAGVRLVAAEIAALFGEGRAARRVARARVRAERRRAWRATVAYQTAYYAVVQAVVRDAVAGLSALSWLVGRLHKVQE